MRGTNHYLSKEKALVTCTQCGKLFLTYQAWAKRGKRKFCSYECKAEWQRENLKGENNPDWKGGYVEKVCEQCGEKFKVPRWRTFRKFCSPKCNMIIQGLKSRTRFHTCTNCGTVFYGKRNAKRTKLFCSKKCEGEYNKGKNNPFYRGKFSEESLRKIIKARHTRPNIPEEKLIEIIDENNLPFQYVGNGEVIIEGKNPDFIHTGGEKKIIELFGIYWHSPLYRRVKPTMTYDAVKTHYARNGYESLIIWDTELKNPEVIKNKIMRFNGGDKNEVTMAE